MRTREFMFLLFCNVLAGCETNSASSIFVNNCSKAVASTTDTGWYRSDDLPTDWIYRNKKKFTGEARFLLEVNSEGKVENCRIIESSVGQAIDESICENLQRRGSFSAASTSCDKKYRIIFYLIKMQWDIDSNKEPVISVHRDRSDEPE
jgi:hypothetical protein